MLRLFANAKYDFIAVRRYAYGLTALFILPGVVFLLVHGLNYSIEFTGGTLIQVAEQEAGGRGGGAVGPRPRGHPRRRDPELRRAERVRGARPGRASPAPTPTTPRRPPTRCARRSLPCSARATSRSPGPRPSARRSAASSGTKAFLAIFLSFFAVLAYLAYRFEWRFGLAAVTATAHDIVATIAFIAMLRLEVSLTVVAAVLSMVGYSLNDTIIIFDRVRENLKKHKKETFEQILNRSINETLPRSVLTHGTTLSSLTALIIFGGEVIRPFALVMFFGVFTGTFSSIYIASPVLMAIEKRWPGQLAKGHLAPAAAPVAPAAGGGRKTAPVA